MRTVSKGERVDLWTRKIELFGMIEFTGIVISSSNTELYPLTFS
jgi:hypothetical protein